MRKLVGYPDLAGNAVNCLTIVAMIKYGMEAHPPSCVIFFWDWSRHVTTKNKKCWKYL